jgi:hypothetical protein
MLHELEVLEAPQIADLASDARKVRVVAQVMRDDVAILGWDEALAGASLLSDDDIVADMTPVDRIRS